MYLSVYGETVTEKVIEKSRFIAYAAHVSGEDEARVFLARVRAEHPMATHVCYGFVADGAGNAQRFSDDGEPQGTAGMPILNVIKAQKLFETAVAVVRYFGGIKLGAGGLTRAYASSAAECLTAAEKREYDTCVMLSLTVDYPEITPLTNCLTRAGYTEFERDFAEIAEFRLAVRERELPAFYAELNNRLHGKVRISELEKRLHPFPIQYMV